MLRVAAVIGNRRGAKGCQHADRGALPGEHLGTLPRAGAAMPFGRLTIARTASAMAAGLLSARAPLSEVMISPSADVRETTTGVPQASDSSAASPKVSCGPGASTTSAEASSSATVCRSETKPVNRSAIARPAVAIGPQRAVAHDDEPGLDAGVA